MPRSGTVRSLLFAACAILATHEAFAATKEPPYEAVVESDEAFARCGPGRNFYPTIKLKRGDHLTVRRHDPGGWFMIDPPPESFSLIRSDEVLREGNVGTIKPLAEGQTPVRVGSAIDPTIDSVYQRQLSSGERVEILGEVTIPRQGSPVQMFKIRPPKGEFRWIDGMSLTSVDQQIQDQQIRDRQTRTLQTREPAESDPFGVPSQTKKKPTRQNPPSSGRATASGKPATPAQGQAATQIIASKQSVAPSGTTTSFVDPRSRLDQIDREFRDMVQRQPATWKLSQIEQAYRELNQQSVSLDVRGQLGLRFSAIDHYKQVKGEYDDYFRLVSNTERKDAELAALQNSLDPRDAHPPIAPPAEIPPATDPSANGAPLVATAPATSAPSLPVPAMSVPNGAAPPNGPAFRAPVQPPMISPGDPSTAGPVLENPVPLPTEPDPEPRARREVRPEPPVQPPPAVVPTETGNQNQELPTNGNFAPKTQASTGGATETMSQPAAPNNSFPPQTPGAGRTLRNPDTLPQGPQPPAAPTPPSSLPVHEAPSPTSVPSLAPPRQFRPQATAGLDGAGIIQRAATPIPGGPRHVLLAPNGRILTYLYPDRGINLDAYLGRSMGIVGPRAYRPELRTDLIVVRGLIPVRLAQ